MSILGGGAARHSVYGEACSDMRPHGSHVNSEPHMGRSEAPLPSDRNGEESLEEPTENNARAPVEDVPHRAETMGARVTERLCGVEFKYNEQGRASYPCNSIQTTLSVNPPKITTYHKNVNPRCLYLTLRFRIVD